MNIINWFKSKKTPGNKIVYVKEIKRDDGTLTATINVLASGEVQLYLQFDTNIDGGNGLSMSLRTATVSGAMNLIDQIDNSFSTWKQRIVTL